MQDEELPAYLAQLGVPGIVDVHTHFMPPAILAKVWAYFDSAGPLLGRAYKFLLSVRLDEGPIGPEAAADRLRTWWSEQDESAR